MYHNMKYYQKNYYEKKMEPILRLGALRPE